MCMMISVILNWPPVEILLKAAPQLIADASLVIVNEGFPILTVLNDPRILVFYQITSCLTCEFIESFCQNCLN